MCTHLHNKQALQTASVGKLEANMALRFYSPVTACNAPPHESCVSSATRVGRALLNVCRPLLFNQLNSTGRGFLLKT